jgi:two-component system chemotaxis response regulator CheY
MIVDDHDPIRKGIKRVLTSMGFGEIIECFDGSEALKILTKKPVDLLICDLYMRQVSGFAVLAHVRKREIGGDIPVIIVTGEGSKEEIVKVADMGAEDYVLKPFQAIDLEKKVIKILNKFYSPTPLLKTLRRAERHFMHKEYKVSLNWFDQSLKLDPGSMRAVHGKALALEKSGKVEEALELLKNMASRNESYHRNFGAMADIYLRQNRVKDAIEALRKELEINSKQPERQIHLAKLLLKEGDALGAIEHYRIALKENPKKRDALMGMGHALAMANNLDKAIYYFKRIRRYHPGATKALETAVRVCLKAAEPKRAELFLKDEKYSHPDRADTYIVLCRFYLNQGRDEEGLAILDELLAKDPDNAAALNMKGLTFLRKRDYQKAIEVLSVVVKVAPSAEGLFALGEAHLGLDQIEVAMENLHKAMSLNPDLPHGLYLLAEAHKRSKQWIKAFYLFRRAAMMGASLPACQAEVRICQQELLMRRAPHKAAS